MNNHKGVALLEVVIALGILILILNISYLKVEKGILEIRSYSEQIISEIRATHQYRRATSDYGCRVEITTVSGKTKISTYKKNKKTNEINLPSNLIFSWSKNETASSGENNSKVDIKFNHEGIYYNSNSLNVGLTMFLKDKWSKKYVKITIVPTTGRVYCYEFL